MIYTKIPRKLKKRLKKITLASHSESYKKYRNMTSKKITIKYIKYKNGEARFSTELK